MRSIRHCGPKRRILLKAGDRLCHTRDVVLIEDGPVFPIGKIVLNHRQAKSYTWQAGRHALGEREAKTFMVRR